MSLSSLLHISLRSSSIQLQDIRPSAGIPPCRDLLGVLHLLPWPDIFGPGRGSWRSILRHPVCVPGRTARDYILGLLWDARFHVGKEAEHNC